ncbi:hypothetical protein, partial [Ralstonia pseudosolanacearum]|uniref:hypothetical protein n=1 Tax=Ralstonia pseudosolanacearum TaxID=1310165 RepID=UPI001E2C6F56
NRLQNSQRGIEQQRWLLPLRSKLELGFTRSPLALLPGAGHQLSPSFGGRNCGTSGECDSTDKARLPSRNQDK